MNSLSFMEKLSTGYYISTVPPFAPLAPRIIACPSYDEVAAYLQALIVYQDRVLAHEAAMKRCKQYQASALAAFKNDAIAHAFGDNAAEQFPETVEALFSFANDVDSPNDLGLIWTQLLDLVGIFEAMVRDVAGQKR